MQTRRVKPKSGAKTAPNRRDGVETFAKKLMCVKESGLLVIVSSQRKNRRFQGCLPYLTTVGAGLSAESGFRK